MSHPSPNRLLVVDDEPDLRTLYELTLVREGYDVESAGSVEEAWAALQQQRFAVVITDMRLPDGSGLDLLRRMDESGRREKGIVITAYGSAENAVEALKAGAYDYLTKPVDLRQFRSVVATALGRAPAPGAETPVPVAVRNAALQTLDQGTVVFTQEPEGFRPQPVEVGRSDDEATEIRGGLKAGDRYVAGNSFILKAELGKGEVGDDD